MPYEPKSPDEERFVEKHPIRTKKLSRPAKDDNLFNANNVKPINRKKERHGYNPGEDEAVYESSPPPAEWNRREKEDSAHDYIVSKHLKRLGVKRTNTVHSSRSDNGLMPTTRIHHNGVNYEVRGSDPKLHKIGSVQESEKPKDKTYEVTLHYHKPSYGKEAPESTKHIVTIPHWAVAHDGGRNIANKVPKNERSGDGRWKRAEVKQIKESDLYEGGTGVAHSPGMGEVAIDLEELTHTAFVRKYGASKEVIKRKLNAPRDKRPEPPRSRIKEEKTLSDVLGLNENSGHKEIYDLHYKTAMGYLENLKKALKDHKSETDKKSVSGYDHPDPNFHITGEHVYPVKSVAQNLERSLEELLAHTHDQRNTRKMNKKRAREGYGGIY